MLGLRHRAKHVQASLPEVLGGTQEGGGRRRRPSTIYGKNPPAGKRAITRGHHLAKPASKNCLDEKVRLGEGWVMKFLEGLPEGRRRGGTSLRIWCAYRPIHEKKNYQGL